MKSLESDFDQPLLSKRSSSKINNDGCCMSCLKAIFCCCYSSRQDLTSKRRIYSNIENETKFQNIVKNQKYNIFTFIPLVLFNEFKFFSNQFFLLLALSQFIEPLKVGFLFSYVAPLVSVLAITLIKELYDDYNRYKKDIEANEAKYKRLNKADLSEEIICSKDIKVGDLLLLEQNDRVPADMIILKTIDEGISSGSLFLRTDQLDGETDWKLRKSVPFIQSNPVLENPNGYSFYLVIDPPTKFIYEFKGVLEIEANSSLCSTDLQKPICEPLSLENTAWANTVLASKKVIGIVIYTGKETRAQLNSSSPRSKVGILDLEINFISKILFTIMILLSFGIIVLKGFAHEFLANLIIFFRFVVLLSSIIPISLKVNLDIAKVVNSMFIHNSKLIPGTIVRNSTLPEELGRIEYIFTDKTGTLTKNEMIFKRLSTEIDKFTHENLDEIKLILKDECAKVNAPMLDILKQQQKSQEMQDGHSKLLENQIEIKKIIRRDRSKVVRDCVSAMALCNNVTPIKDENGTITYQASSPDEVALVELANSLDMKLTDRTDNEITLLNAGDFEEKYQILANFPFSSETKRMGILLKNLANGHIIFFLKGAENVIENFVKEKYIGHIRENCEELATMGLRTLVLTQKLITEEFFRSWITRYNEAKASLDNRNENIRKTVSELENNMEFLCITGVEDLLQDEVADTLESLKKAGIKVWMLTGDKVETATCIAISAGLIPATIRNKSQKIFYIKEVNDKEKVQSDLEALKTKKETILIIDGICLDICLNELEELFFEVSLQCPAVVCCRCSPTQKANIVNVMKKYSGKRTLSIGDGGNDVAMIQEANIGVGIEGKEGKQASLAADYSITKFMHLKLLVLWFGRQSYKNTALMANFVIHRGLIISFIQAIFSVLFYSQPIPIYNGMLIMGYSTVYTFLPVLSLLVDRDTDMNNIIKFPLLYKNLQKGRELNMKAFLYWHLKSTFQASIIMIGSVMVFEVVFLKIVTITFTSLIFAEILNVYTQIRNFNWIMFISLVGTFLSYLLSLIFFRSFLDLYYIIDLKIAAYITTLTLVSWLPFYLFTKIKKACYPEDYEKLDMISHDNTGM